MATCHLCPDGDNTVPDAEVLDHLRVIHPNQYGDGPTEWPDGQPVVIDATDDAGWACGAFEPEQPDRMAYRCSEPYGHDGDHRAVIDGQTVATWPRKEAR